MDNNLKRDFIWYSLGAAFSSVNSFLFMIVVTRINGLDDAGIFSLCFAASNMLGIIGLYSGRTLQVTDTISGASDQDYVINRILNCILMVAGAFIWCAINDYSPIKSKVLLLLIIYKILVTIAEVFYGVFQKNNRLDIAGKSLFTKGLFNILIFSIVLMKSHNLEIACISLTVVDATVMLVYDFPIFLKYINKKKWFTYNSIKLYQFGFSTFIFTLIANYMINIPRYAIDSLLSLDKQAIYGVIIMPVTVMMLLNSFIFQPLITKLKDKKENNDREGFEKIVKRLTIINIGFGILVSVLYVLIGIDIIAFIYNVPIQEYRFYVPLISLGASMYAISNVLSNVLLILNVKSQQVIVYAITSLISYPLVSFLVKSFNIYGGLLGYFVMMLILILNYTLLYKITLKNQMG